MKIEKERIIINDDLKRRLTNTATFKGKEARIIEGNIIYIPNTNISYIEPHKLIINDKMYYFFGQSDCCYLYENTLSNPILLKDIK